jgi:hypothetical protein
MNLPDEPIANEGFFATHFLTVKNQETSKDFCVRIPGGEVIKSENPCHIKVANTWITFWALCWTHTARIAAALQFCECRGNA